MANPPSELQRLMPRHYEIINLSLAGYGPKEIAQALEMTPQAITLITKSAIFQHEISRRRANQEEKVDDQLASVPALAKQILENASVEAAMVHVENLGSTNDKTRHSAAEAILTRSAVGESKDAQTTPNVTISVESMNLIVLALKESEEARKPRVVELLPIEVNPVSCLGQ